MSSQATLDKENWTVDLSDTWEVLGPFPIHAREQHYLSPSFPLNLSDRPIDLTKSYPSSLADNGQVFWSTRTVETNGQLKISFPHVRWDRLRSTEGWASLQHHSVLRTFITVHPPNSSQLELHDPPRLLVDLIQGSFFTILPVSGHAVVPKWYSGNIYAMERALPRAVELPISPSPTSPTVYEVFVSGDYEIRLFGDPLVHNAKDSTPTLTISLSIKIENYVSDLVLEPALDVVPDFVQGWAFGNVIGISLRNTSLKWWTVKAAKLSSISDDVSLELLCPTRIAPTQTRLIPLKFIQASSFHNSTLGFDLTVESGPSHAMTSVVPVIVTLTQVAHWSTPSFGSSTIKATYAYSSFIPTAFLVKPPSDANEVGVTPKPPVIALHGAGVDIFGGTFFSDSLPRQRHSWTVIPTGLTSWGLDWHGPSTEDVWSSLDALINILHSRSEWGPWMISADTRVVLIGHSNGGQGTWHIAERYPDKVLAAVPAAGYIKPEGYVSLTQSRSAHFIDPALWSILQSSLTPDDDDLFLSNLVHMPILAIHGGDDENVPTWNSREAVSILKSWNTGADVTLKIDPGQPHWYDDVFSNHDVQDFIHAHLQTTSSGLVESNEKAFTVTVAVPAESASLHGFQVERLFIPGRLARLHVTQPSHSPGLVIVQAINVLQFTIKHREFTGESIVVDGQDLSLKNESHYGNGLFRFKRNSATQWECVHFPDEAVDIQPSGRLSLILTSASPILLVIPHSSDPSNIQLLYALRISHDLNVYYKLETEIIFDSDAMHRYEEGTLGSANIVVIDGPQKTSFGKWLLLQKKSDIRINEAGFLSLDGFNLSAPSTGVMFLHPHPTSSLGNVLFLRAEDEDDMETVLRLFPMRTGLATPDFLIVSRDAKLLGATGVKGAGVWDNGWKLNKITSWIN